MGITEVTERVTVEIDTTWVEWARRIMEMEGEDTLDGAIGLALGRYLAQITTLERGEAYVVTRRSGTPDRDLCRTLHEKLKLLTELELRGRQDRKPKRLARWLPAGVRAAVYLRDGGKCARCESTCDLDVHHVKPRYNGGGDEVSNLLLLCRTCHAATHREMGDGCDRILMQD